MSKENPIPDWLTEMDKEILEVLSSGLVLTPSIIAENIGRSRKGVSSRINSLQAGELARKMDRGKYRITDDGRTVWKFIDSSDYENRRESVAERKFIRREFGVSLEEYHSKVTEQIKEIEQGDENNQLSEEEKINMAFERAAERLS